MPTARAAQKRNGGSVPDMCPRISRPERPRTPDRGRAPIHARDRATTVARQAPEAHPICVSRVVAGAESLRTDSRLGVRSGSR